jgi:hypothetical protein
VAVASVRSVNLGGVYVCSASDVSKFFPFYSMLLLEMEMEWWCMSGLNPGSGLCIARDVACESRTDDSQFM